MRGGMMDNTTCFNCTFFRMCLIRHFIFDNLAFDDSDSIKYNEKFSNVYKAIAEACVNFIAKEKDNG